MNTDSGVYTLPIMARSRETGAVWPQADLKRSANPLKDQDRRPRCNSQNNSHLLAVVKRSSANSDRYKK